MKLLQLSRKKPAFRDGVKGNRRWKEDAQALKALAEFRGTLAAIPGATATRGGRVHIPTASLAARTDTLLDAARKLSGALVQS